MLKETVSLCPECYRHVPATLHGRVGGVYMHKVCPVHGEDWALVDRHERVWHLAKALQRELSPPEQVCLVDASHRCNMHCTYCYYDRDPRRPDPTIRELASEAVTMQRHYGVGRVVLTGGEPTVRDDLPEVLRAVRDAGSSAEFLTNGVRLADKQYCLDVMREVSYRLPSNEAGVYLSMHPEADPEIWAQKREAIENIRSAGTKILCLLWTVDNLEQIPDVVLECRQYRDVAAQFRIRAAAPHWRTVSRATEQIFASDIYMRLAQLAVDEGVAMDIRWPADTKASWLNVYYDGMSFRLIHWPTEFNVDLEHLVWGPYYRARNGQIAHFVHSLLINQGMDKGWLAGRNMFGHRCLQQAA